MEVKCLEAAKSEYLVTMPILVYDRDVQCIPDVSPHLLVVYCANRSSDLSDKTKLRPMPMEISKQHISQIVELLSSESTEGEVKTVALDYNDYFRCALCIGVWLQASGVCIASVYQKKVT